MRKKLNNSESIDSINAAENIDSHNFVSAPPLNMSVSGIQMKSEEKEGRISESAFVTDSAHDNGCDCTQCVSAQMKMAPFQMKSMAAEEHPTLSASAENNAGHETDCSCNQCVKVQMKKSSAKLTSASGTANNTSMPDAVQKKMEVSFGHKFSDVKINSNSEKAADINALAYTQGNQISFAPGEYQPNTQSGQELLGHELSHTIQQKEGRVSPTTQTKGLPINDDSSLENEADSHGQLAAQGKNIDGRKKPSSTNSQGTSKQLKSAIQRQEKAPEYSAADQILTNITTEGAGEQTKGQDGHNALSGTDASNKMAATDFNSLSAYVQIFIEVGNAKSLPPALLAAIASRESRGGTALAADGTGDHGNGFGLMQVDKRFHTLQGAYNSKEHIEQAAGILKSSLDKVTENHPDWTEAQKLRGATAAYNFGVSNVQTLGGLDAGTTGDDYSSDVWARARYYASLEEFKTNPAILTIAESGSTNEDPMEQIVHDVYLAIKGVGTDEALLIEALSRLNQSNSQIEDFKSKFTSKYDSDPIEWIQGEVSNNMYDGNLLDLVNRLLNLKVDNPLSETTEETTATIKTSGGTLNVRATPDSSNNDNIVEKLNNGDVVSVLTEKDGWLQIGAEKWISKGFADLKTETRTTINESELETIAETVNQSIKGRGTDETSLLNALSMLENDTTIIEKFKQTYKSKYGTNLLSDITADLDDGFTNDNYLLTALRLLGEPIPKSEPDKEPVPGKDKSPDAPTNEDGDPNESEYLKYLRENEYKSYKVDQEGNARTFTIKNEDARIREKVDNGDGTASFNTTSDKIPNETIVKITDMQINDPISRKVYAYAVNAETGQEYGWTSNSNFDGKLLGEVMGMTKAQVFSDAPNHKTIVDKDARIRQEIDENGEPAYESTGESIPFGTYVAIEEQISGVKLKNGKKISTGNVAKVKKVEKDGENFVEKETLGYTTEGNFTDGFIDPKGPTSMWRNKKYFGQTDIINIVGDQARGRRQLATNDGVGLKILEMFNDARANGVELDVNSGFRDFAKQKQLRDDLGGAAAIPGCSDHQSGRAYDLNNKRNVDAYDWLRENAWKYGLVQTYPYYGKEGHHWDYKPELAQQGSYTYFKNRFSPGVTFGTGKGQVDPRVNSDEKWMSGNSSGTGKGSFRVYDAAGDKIELRKNED